MRSGGSRSDPDRGPVKLEIFEEDSLKEEHGPLNKRRRKASASSGLGQLGAGANAFSIPPCQYNPLDEPSPLGLRLRKSPSLLDLIQMRISQGDSTSEISNSQSHGSGIKKETQNASATTCSIEKMKASNFPASVLRIGQYEYKSKHEGDLVAKCYFAKRKLVWEVLEGGLKSKIEIQWSDIIGLKVVCPDNGPGTLNVVLAKHPLFFRETNPQPRKHTLWQATADFTDGESSINRQHFLECPSELLSKNFEKLIQCDSRLKYLSQQAEIVLDSPYFEATASIFKDLDDSKGPGEVVSKKESPLSILQLSLSVESASSKTERLDPLGATSETRSREASSPNSGTDARSSGVIEISEVVDSKDTRSEQHIKLPGLSKSISVSDFMNHLGQCISDSGIDLSSGSGSPCQEIINITEYLLNDTNIATASSDEKSLMSRVNSLCCLLQQEPTSCIEEPDKEKTLQVSDCTESSVNNSEVKDQKQGMSRKDSFSDLLLHLPRIASLPKFLFDIPETG